jgi:hypothetical protein
MTNPDLPGSGLITRAVWPTDTGSPVTVFRTQWTVPQASQTFNQQRQIYVYEGLQAADGTMLLRAVLQFGQSPAGGAEYWTVAVWWTDSVTGEDGYSEPVIVSPGEPLIAVIKRLAQNGNQVSYACTFENIPAARLVIDARFDLTMCIEALEAYGITQASDYPAADCTPMTQIHIETAAGLQTPAWAPDDVVTDFGQHTVVVSPTDVELYYRSEPSWGSLDLNQKLKAPQAAGDPVAYSWNLDTLDHVVYRGVDDHIHQLTYDGSWHWTDVTHVADPPPTSTVATDPSAYTYDHDHSQHVVYRGLDDHIHELWSDGGSNWAHNDLTTAVPGGNAPLAASKPFGYVWPQDNSQHVVYRGHDNAIHELYTHGGWKHSNLSQQVNIAPTAAGGPAGYVDEDRGVEHVVYRDQKGNLHELYCELGGSWQDTELPAVAAGDPFGLIGVDSHEHILYRGLDTHLHELRRERGSWSVYDLNRESGGPPPTASDPVAYRTGFTMLVYRGTDQRLHRLRQVGTEHGDLWRYNDLTASINAPNGPPPTPVGNITGYNSFIGPEEHVVYRAVGNHIILLSQ